MLVIMVVEEGGEGRLEEVTEEGTRGGVGVCRVPDVGVNVSCADFRAFGVLKVK